MPTRRQLVLLQSRTGRGDTELLEELLATEQRLVSAYEAALRRDAVDRALGELLRDHEREHVGALLDALDRRAAAGPDRNPRAIVPSPDLTAALRDRASFAAYAVQLEGQAAAAYARAAAALRTRRLRQPLGSIMACEAAHAVALRASLGESSLLG